MSRPPISYSKYIIKCFYSFIFIFNNCCSNCSKSSFNKIIDSSILFSVLISTNTKIRIFIIKTKLEIGGKTWEIEVTLTNRDSMGFRMLLGREAMSGRVLVDPEQRYLLGQPTTDKLKEYIDSELTNISSKITSKLPKVTDPTTRIKLNESVHILDKLKNTKRVGENHILTILNYYKLIKELNTIWAKDC